MTRKLSVIVSFVLLALVSSVILVSAHPAPGSLAPPTTSMPKTGHPASGLSTSPLSPVSSGFPYQGSLQSGAGPANGQYDLQFTLYDALTGGNQVGSPSVNTFTNQTVSNGLFNVTLNFGTAAFQGDARWLEIAVRPTGGSSYNTLSPRQPMTPAPYAMSLMPGAVISGTSSSPLLTASNGTGTGVNGYTNNNYPSLNAAVVGTNAGNGNGVYATTNGGWAVNGVTTGNGGIGVRGVADSSIGIGVVGSSASGQGVYGNSSSGEGVHGNSTSGVAIHGTSASGEGVYGDSTGNDGVHGRASLTVKSGVFGENIGGGYGVYGSTTSNFPSLRAGVRGNNNGSDPGVFGTSSGWGVYGLSTDSIGVHGQSSSNYGVDGESTSGTGVIGHTNGSGYGVLGISTDGDGMRGVSTNGTGVVGVSTANGAISGVFGVNDSAAGYGVHGLSAAGIGIWGNSSTGEGVRGQSDSGNGVVGIASSSTGYAGLFQGDVQVTGDIHVMGTVYGTTKNFKIDDPLDPANKYLNHSVIESSDMKDLYDGVAVLDTTGEVWVQMPSWFDALNKDFRYQLTAIGAPGPNLYIAQELTGNRFKIAGGSAEMKVSWMITGIRHDLYAEHNPMQVEQEKPATERGTYMHPEYYSQGNK